MIKEAAVNSELRHITETDNIKFILHSFVKANCILGSNSEVCHLRRVFKLYGKVNLLKNTTINYC